MRDIVLRNVSKRFEGKQVLQNLSLTIEAGKITCLMAPSGYGKTTLLRLLMRLVEPESGEILGMNDLAMSAVFQEDRLCEHLSGVENIRLVNPALSVEQTLDAMESMMLIDCENQPVRELSGGMRRRVVLLRALLAEYDILFLDEPFKGLDADTKALVIDETRKRCQGRTVLLVTHVIEEAHAMRAEHIVTLESFE